MERGRQNKTNCQADTDEKEVDMVKDMLGYKYIWPCLLLGEDSGIYGFVWIAKTGHI